MAALLKRPEVTYDDLLALGWETRLDPSGRASAEAEVKYEGYISRMMSRLEEMDRMGDVLIPDEFYDLLQRGLDGFSWEARETLLEIRPKSLGQASRLSGVRAAHVDQLAVHLKAMNAGSHAQSHIQSPRGRAQSRDHRRTESAAKPSLKTD
jgi:tRNA uridine 5-carboxymethylaminomethyl modification enzyme